MLPFFCPILLNLNLFLSSVCIPFDDLMTGLYTREYLFTNISDRLFNDKETSYYALYVDVKNFQMVNRTVKPGS